MLKVWREGRFFRWIWQERRQRRRALEVWPFPGMVSWCFVTKMNIILLKIPHHLRCCHSQHHQHRGSQILNHPLQCHSCFRDLWTSMPSSTCKLSSLWMLWWVWVWGIAGTSCYCDQCLYQAPESWRSTEGGPEPEPGQRRERGSIRARYQWLSVPGLGQLSHHQPPQHRDTQKALASDVWSKTFIMDMVSGIQKK